MARKGRVIRCLTVFALLCAPAAASLAGTTGKLTGRVLDKESHEPLVGVNITVEGTMLGGTTDVEGRFTVLNVPPRTLRLKASLVGYGTTLVNDVRVEIDQTTAINIEMSQQTLNLGEVVISAERRIVKRDVSTSVASVTDDEVKSLPVTDVSSVVTLQAGVENGLVIRGGGADQSLFLLDGATQRDPRNNQPITGIALSAVQEVSIERGGFNAEYGQLRSGIVNVVTKEGSSSDYFVTATGRYQPYTKKYSGISPFDPNSMFLRPYLDPAVCWTGTTNGAWDQYTQRQYPKFDGWNAISNRTLTNPDPSKWLSPAGAQRLFEWQHRKQEDTKSPDYNIDAGIGGPVPFVGGQLGNLRFFASFRDVREMLLIPLTRPDYVENFGSLRLTSDIAPGMKLDITGTIGKSYNVAVNGEEQSSSTDYIRSPDEITANMSQLSYIDARIFSDAYYSEADVTSRFLGAHLSHVINSKAYYDVRVEYVQRQYSTNPSYARDTANSYQIFPGYFTNAAPFGYDPALTVGIDGMLLGGHTSTARDTSDISALTVKGDFTAQLDVHDQVKVGVELVYNDLNIDYGAVKPALVNGNTFVKWHRFPMQLSGYVQDKLEFEGFVANLGLRADYSALRTAWPDVSPFDPNFYSRNYDPTIPYPMIQSKGEWFFSPRLGISHPITENSKLYFNYGHFRQLSTYEQLLRLARGADRSVQTIGDPSLTAAKTIAYELGYDHALFDEYLIQVAAFYRDITDQADIQTYQGIGAVAPVVYTKVTSNSYQDIRGFEVTLRKLNGKWWYGFANYTYPVTSGGHFDRQQIFEDPSLQLQYDQRTSTSYQYKPTPTPYARISLGIFTPEDVAVTPPLNVLLGGWNLTLLGDWRAGDYVTWDPNNLVLTAPNLKLVDWYNLNLRLMKSLPLGPVKLQLFVDLQNVFDTRRLNLNSFYDFNDGQDYYNSLHLPVNAAWNNIPGNDKAGDYRKDGVDFVPMQAVSQLSGFTPSARAIYYLKSTGTWWNYVNNQWEPVDAARLDRVMRDKAYIDMPNITSFNFLNPRNIFFGLTTTLEF